MMTTTPDTVNDITPTCDARASSVCGAREASVCEACGQTFDCGAQSGDCWCAGVELSEETRVSLRARYARCLCRACLEGPTAERENVNVPANPDAAFASNSHDDVADSNRRERP